MTDDRSAERERVLADWWLMRAQDEIDVTVAKAVEYGARDLIAMGHELAHIAHRELDDAQAAELGCVQYLVGKMARVSAAWSEGRMPSDDTLLDIGIYVRMIQRIREVGSWPGLQ